MNLCSEDGLHYLVKVVKVSRANSPFLAVGVAGGQLPVRLKPIKINFSMLLKEFTHLPAAGTPLRHSPSS